MRESINLRSHDMRLHLTETLSSSDGCQITSPPAVHTRPLFLLRRGFALSKLRKFIRFEDPPFRLVRILTLVLVPAKGLEFSCLSMKHVSCGINASSRESHQLTPINYLQTQSALKPSNSAMDVIQLTICHLVGITSTCQDNLSSRL